MMLSMPNCKIGSSEHSYTVSNLAKPKLVGLLLCTLSICCGRKLDDWKLVWSDEFGGTEVNRTRWNFEYGDRETGGAEGGWGNEEKQWYTDRSENAFISNGHLVIQARQEPMNGYGYTSARMVTRGKGDWQYGRIEIRAKFPCGKGIWPLIWMLPTYNKYGTWPTSGELDIAVMTNGSMDNEIYTGVFVGPSIPRLHMLKQPHRTKAGKPKYSDAFHVFAVEVEKDRITWYINDAEVDGFKKSDLENTYFTYPFNERFFLTLSLAVGGKAGDPQHTPFPKRFKFDYVRVYQKYLV